MSDQEENEELTLAQAKREYGYALNTLLQAIQRGSLPARKGKVKVEREVKIEVDAWFVRRQDIEEYIAQAKKKGKGPGSPTRHQK